MYEKVEKLLQEVTEKKELLDSYRPLPKELLRNQIFGATNIDLHPHPSGNDIGLLTYGQRLVLYKTLQGKRELLANLTTPQLLLIEYMLASKSKPLSTQENNTVWDTLPLVIKESLERTCSEIMRTKK